MEWTEQRKFTMRRLRDFGVGKSTMEDVLKEDLGNLFEMLDKKLGKPFKMQQIFNVAVVNGLWKILTGKRFDLDDPKLKDLVKRMDELFKVFGTGGSVLSIMPKLRYFAPGLTVWARTQDNFRKLLGLMTSFMDDHVSNFTNCKEPEDFIDAFLKQVEESQIDTSFHGQLGHQNLSNVLLDLLLAGSETTASALTYSVLLMIKYPEIQKKVQEEIFQEVGIENLVSITDKPKLPYTEAVVEESLRHILGSLAIPHYALEDFTIGHGEYFIPKDTWVLPNLYEISKNPDAFQDPHTFNPQRFLDANGKFVKNGEFAVFGVGKRECPGKSLAQMELFLFFANMMQRYNFQSVLNDLTLLDLKPVFGLAPVPKPFEVLMNKN